MKCVNIATKEFKELAKSNNVDLGTLEMIVHKYWAETRDDTVFPTSVYIQAQLGNVKYVESGENVRELWETQYKEPKQFSTLEKVQQATNEALKFFPEDAVTYHKTADGKYILSVKQPVKSLSTSTKEVLKDSSLKNTEHFGEVSSTATRELLENIANSNRRQFLFMEEEEVKSKIADSLQKSRIPRRTAKRLTDNIEKMSKKGILEELSILEREQRDFELIARNLGIKEKKSTSNTEEETQFAVETKHSFTFNDGTTISTPFELNSEQKDALNAMDLFIHSRKPEDFSMTLSGYAGTGKTSIMEMLAEKARMDGIPIKFTASTNKASQVLKDRVMKRGFIAQTLHRLFNYRQQQDETKAYDAKETITVPGGRPKYFWGDIVVIDEASMIDDVLYQNLIEDAKNNNLKIIFVGDRAQLAPVNQATISKVFIDPDPNRKVVELFKVERTGDNAILEEATGLRNSQALTKKSKFNSKGQGVAYISSKNRTAIVDTIQHFLPHIKDNPDYFRILAWSNAAVSEHNETVRRLLGYSGKMPQVGEPMVGYTNWGWHEASDYESPYDLVNSEPYKVVNVGQPRTITKSFQRVSDGVMTTVQLQAIPLTLEDSTGERKQFNFIDVKSNAQNWAAAKQLALQKDALWKKYKTAPKGKKNIVGTKSWYRDQANQIEQFLFINDSIEIPDSASRRGKRTLQSKVIDFGYAMTVHKSQGSTFTHVIMDDVNISQAKQEEDDSPATGNVASADAQLANAEFEAVGPKKKTSFNFRAMAGLDPNTPETLIKEAPKVSPTRQAELANIRQQLKYVAMTRATDTVTVISENPISEDSVLNHLSNTQNTAPNTNRTSNSPSSSTNAMKMSSAQIWNYMSEVTSNMPSQTVPYTPKGKERQVYTVHDGHIFNKDGIEVFAGDSVDRNKILANLALKEGRAVEVTHKDHRYVVDGNKNITSVTTGKVMAWGYENGDRKAILGLAEQQFRSIIYNTQRSVSSQLVTQLKKLGFEVYGKEALEQYLKEHPNAMNQQALEEQKEMAEIKAKAIADGTFMKAPNGKPTNLNERQWLQVRTKAFKKWFGDWLTYQRIQNAKVIWGHPGTGKTRLFKQGRKDIIDFDSEYKAKLGDFREREVLKKEIGKGAYNQKLDKLFEEARQEAIKSGRKLLVSDLHFLRDRADDLDLITNISNEEFIERSHQRGEHDEADKMEWKNSINAAMQNISSDKVIETSGYISDLMDGTNVSKVVDENGEPLVVYHGTPNEFTTFDKEKIGSTTDYGVFGTGFYFALTTSYANIYGNNVNSFFLNIKNPYHGIDAGGVLNNKEYQPRDIEEAYSSAYENAIKRGKSKEEASRIAERTKQSAINRNNKNAELLRGNYDGVDATGKEVNSSEKQFVAFEPNQIKSATDNIGTFSTENDDIQMAVEYLNTTKKNALVGIPEIKIDEYPIFIENAMLNQERIKDGIGYANTYNNFYVYDVDNDGMPVPKIQIPISEKNKILINKIINGEPLSNKEADIDDHFKLSWIEQQRSGTLLAYLHEMSRRDSANDGLDNSNDGAAKRKPTNLFHFNEKSNTDSKEYRRESLRITREINAIVTNAKKSHTLFKAPNGKPSNLNPMLWIMVRTKNFKEWFGDWLKDPEHASKVLDENGEPKVVYHTGAKNIRVFNNDIILDDDRTPILIPNAIYTTDDYETAASYEQFDEDLIGHYVEGEGIVYDEPISKSQLYELFVNIKNPRVIDAKGKKWNEINIEGTNKTTRDIEAETWKSDYDGVIIKNVVDYGPNPILPSYMVEQFVPSTVQISFNPNQVKSASIDSRRVNNGRYSKYNNDIQSFTTPSGEVYGFVTKDGKIYLDETVISPEHPIHEYTHIWDRIVAQKNPKLWKRGVELMKELDLWKEIEENEHYGKKWIEKGITGERLENLIASEVHARLAGQEGETILNKVAQKKGHEGIVDKLKSWMLDVWKALKGTFSNWSDSEIAKLTLDDFKQMTIRDFADAIDLVNAPDVTTNSPENTTKAIEKSTNRVRDYYRWQRKHITFDKDSHTYFYDGMPIDYSVTEYKDYVYGKPNILGDYSHSREMGNSVDALTRDFFSKDRDPRNLAYPNLNEERKNQIIRDLERLKKFFDKKFSGNYKVITTEFPIAGRIKTPDGEKTVAGTIDMLIIDGKGNLHILDMKVKKNSIDAYNDRRDYTFQLNAYRQLLETIFPEFSGKIKDLNLIWFDTAYPRQGKEATFVTHDSGMVTVSDDKVTDLPLSEYDSWKTPSLKSNVEESLVPLERKNVLENVKSLKEGWEKENVEQLPSPQPGKALGEDAEIYSGAAEGSDTIWANKAKELGINVKEYTVKDWDKLPQTWKDKLDAEYIEVVRALKRLPYKRDSYKGKLVRRDMMQADKADAIFAIGHVVKPGEMGKQYTNNSNHDIIDGGTGYAVQRGIIRGIPVYVFDQVDGRWKVWDKESNSFVTTSEPALTPHAATIGTREIEENGKQAIESVLNKIPRTVDRISVVQKIVDKYHSTFTDFSKYGDASIIVVDSSTMSDEELERWYKSLGEAYTLDGKDKKVKTAKEIREYLKESRTKAYLIHDGRETHAIFIDAAYITPEEVEETVFHENIHRVIRKLKHTDTTGILKAFWDNSEDKLFKLNLKVAYGIDEANLYNEYFTHQLGRALADRNIQPLLSRLTPEGKMLLNEILCDLGYISIEERNANKKTGEIATPEIEKANVQQQGQQPTSQVQQSIIQQHQGIWTRESAEKDQETLYIFTDNTDRDSGSGEVPADSWYAQRYGQGHHYPNATTARIRGLNNARPISTVKWFYRNHQGVSHPKYNRTSEALWHDKDFEEFKKVVDAEFADILAEWKTGKYKRIMFPQGDGLFNGEISAITKERTPKIYEYLQKKYQELQQQVQQVVSQSIKQTMPNQQPSQSAITSQETPVPSSDTEMDIWWGSGEKDPNRQNAELSNFARREFDFETSLDDIPHFTSVEQAFQYHKLIEMYDEMDEDTFNEWEDKILNADAAEARRLGRRIPMSMGARARWDEKSSDIMKELLKASFEQNEEARKKLFETGNATLTHNYGTGKWKTEFPRLLMEVRDELREEYAEQAPYEVSTSSEVDESQAETPQETETTQNVETRIPVSLPNFANVTGIQDDMVVDAQWKVAEMVTLDNEIKDENTDEENQELVNRILAVAKAKDKASYKRSVTTQKKLGEYNRLNKGIDNLMKSRLLSSSEVRHAAEQVANYISDTITEIQKGDKTVQEVFPRLNSAFNGKGASRKDIVQNIGIDNFIQLAKDNIDPSVNMNITSRSLARQAQLLIDNWEALMTFATDTFVMNEGFGIRKDYTRRGFSVTESQHLTMEDLNQHNDVDSVREKEGDEQEHWQVEFRTVDAINSMSELVRIAFHECYLIDPNKEGEDKRVMSKWNIPERVDMKEAVQSVLKWTQGALTLDEMVNKMREHVNEAPWLEQMINRLSDESGAETDFQSQFFGVMNRHFQLYSIVRNKNGKFVSQIINEKPALLKLTRTVESKYKMGEHPLLSSTGINTSSLEALRKTLSELETLKAALEEYEKQHLDEKAELSGEDRATAFRNLSAMSKLLGFDIPNEIWDRVINVDNIKEMTKYLRYIVNSLDKVISSKQENYDPFKFKGLNSIGGTLQNLMAPVADIMENTGVSSFFDDGKMYQSYVTPSWMTKLMKKFKGNDKDVVDFIMREYGNSEWFKEQIDSYEGWKSGWRNKWLERLINDPAAREIFAHKVELNFNKHNYMRTMTDTEYALSLVAEFFAEASKDKDGRMPAWFRIPMLSNKPSSEFIRQYAYTGMEYKEAITEDLFGIYLQELMRIQTVIRRNKKEGDPGFIKNFDTNGRKFCFLPFLNKEMENNTRLGYLLNEKIKSEGEFEHEAELEKLVTKAIKDHMDERVKKIMVEWKQKGILKAAEKIDGIGRGEQKVAENIEKFLWNDHLASMNILQLTIGDIAFYKDAEDLQKRLAQIHAPGTRANIRARDYETGEFVSDGTYRTIILKDFDGFKSNIIANITEVFDRKIARAKNDAERKSLEVLKDYLVRPRTYKEDGTIDDEGGEYWKINVADAQGYSSPSSYRKKALMFGRWSKEAEKIFKRLQHNDYDMTQLKTVFQPLKPFVYSRIEKTIAGKESPIQKIYAPFQAKNAEYLLVMAGAIIEGEEAESGHLGRPNLLKAIHRIMEESESLKPGKGIDTVQFESAIKSSLQTPIDIQQFAEDPNGEERAYQHMKNLIFMNEKDGEGNRIYVNYNNSEYVHEASYEDYCLQQEVPEHFKDHDQAHGSQIRMIMPADLDLYYNYNKKEGREDESNKVYYEWTETGGKKMKLPANKYKKLYEETISANIEDSLDELVKELHLDTEDIKERNAILSDFLQREIVDSPRYGIDLFQACSLNENGEFRIPKGDPIQAKRIEQLINSLIKNRVNKQTIPGGPVVQVTNFGTSRQLHIRFKDKSKEGALIPLEEEYNPAEHGGKSYKDYCKDNQGGIAYFEVFAPIPSEDWIEKFGNPDGTIDIAAIEKIDPKLLEMVSYRIPTEDKYSCAPMKIVGFLPRQAGEAIMLPYELTTIDGSDFDVDKRYIMRRDIDIVVDKDKVRKHLFNKTTLGWEKSGRKLDFAAKNKLRDEINIFLDNPEKMKDFDAFNSALYAEYKKYIKEGRPYKASYPKEARRIRNNRIIDMSWAVLTHEMTADEILNPGNFEQQKEVGYRISAFKNPANRTKNWEDLVGKDSKALKKLSYVEKDLTWVDTQLQFYHQNNAGSSLIGVFAVNKVAHATLGEDKIFADIKEICGDNPLKIAGFEFKSRMEVDPMYDKKGNLIGKTLGSLVAASADTAKDPVLDLMNINMSTAGMLTSLLRLGMPFEDAAIFLSQDIITEVLEEMNIRRLQGQDSSLESIVHSKKKEIVDEIKEFDPEFKIGPDDNIHKEEITRQELINGLRKGSSLATQYKVLEALVRVKALADSMRNLTFATRFNSISSAVGPLIIDNIILEHKMDNLRLGPGKSSTGFYYEGGRVVTIDNIFDRERHPILGSFGKTVDLAKNLFMDMPAGSTGFRNLLNTLQFRFGDKFAEKFYKDRKLMDAFSMFYQSYILVQEGLINPRDCEYYVNQFPHVFYSKDYKSKYPDNALIQAIDLTLSERTGRAFLNISISGMSTTEKERLSSAWYDLQKVDPQLSKDLFNYCFFRAGIGFSPKSFMSLLNTYVKEELQSVKEQGLNYTETVSYVDIFRKLPSIKDPEFLIELFVRNNWNYPRLVKTAGGENTNYKYYDDHLIVDSDSDMMALKGAPFIKIKNDGEDTYTLWQLLGKEKDNKERRYYVKIAALGENGEFLQILPTNGEKGKPIVESQSDIINNLPMEDPNNSDLAFFMESDPETFEDMEDDVEIEPAVTEEAKEIAEEAEVLLRDAFGIKESTSNSKKDNSKLTVSRFKEFVDDAFERLGITMDEERAKEETDKYC